jgi:NTE family protein
LQTGVSVRITKQYLADYRLGKIDNPKLSPSQAVTASSAFPPFLSPFKLKTNTADWSMHNPNSKPELRDDTNLREHFELSDGGVYDNMGLESLWNDPGIKTVYVSDAGAPLEVEDNVLDNWASLMGRTFSIINEQARAVRKRWLLEKLVRKELAGTFWATKTTIADYGLVDTLIKDSPATHALQNLRTRLDAFSDQEQKQLINWAYALADAGHRKWVDPLSQRGKLPFP